jgi:hypothetical protein
MKHFYLRRKLQGALHDQNFLGKDFEVIMFVQLLLNLVAKSIVHMMLFLQSCRMQ